ncbi:MULTISPECIES: type II RES/Xre toxin-antitoxin system antitoxin [Mucilaginibacter]|uniref:type II RES/Xre toxin-antitoxin system antitoxin n=1 Tax=Mucilaginibacter TaxID=423349 RepID=UPI0019962756|nr:antitoxin Xre/MbcA/ParS toxin-binding domain-containing protein [Mucilaginibacter rubeus]GGB07142.1 hypothetical protein GCM10011500_23600 [Mucilaginibacter rubeus]
MSKKVFHKQNAAEAKKLDKSPIDKLLGDLEITVEKEVRIGKKVANESTESIEDQLRKSRERIMRLKDLSMKLRAINAEELQAVPAYRSSKIDFEQDIVVKNKSNQSNSDALSDINNLSDFDIISLARKGIAKSALLSFAKKISLNIQELANILHISERTLQRYEDDAIIKTEYAEKAIELARLYTRGEEVFESMDKFKIWVKTPSVVFRGEAPVTILDTSAGFDMVFKELGRIEHGIFA